MSLSTRELPLGAQARQFAALLETTEITDKDGRARELEAGLAETLQILAETRDSNASIFVVGNGGSAAVASHAVIDLINAAKLRAFTLHDPATLTCIVNDYGYENAYSRLLAHMARPSDVLIAISSSGRSQNILNAAKQGASNGAKVITLSGFAENNALRALGDINIWLDSKDYGMVEIGHQFILHNLSDRLAIANGRSPTP